MKFDELSLDIQARLLLEEDEFCNLIHENIYNEDGTNKLSENNRKLLRLIKDAIE